MNRIERMIEAVIFASRWVVLAFLIGLIIGLAALLFAFSVKLVAFIPQVLTAELEDIIVGLLKLVDLLLVGNLIVIVICSSYENFVRPVDPALHANWPTGLVGIGFSGLKQKLLGSIVAITAVSALEWFMDIDRHADNVKLGWVVTILLSFAIAMLVLALADRIGRPVGNKDH